MRANFHVLMNFMDHTSAEWRGEVAGDHVFHGKVVGNTECDTGTDHLVVTMEVARDERVLVIPGEAWRNLENDDGTNETTNNLFRLMAYSLKAAEDVVGLAEKTDTVYAHVATRGAAQTCQVFTADAGASAAADVATDASYWTVEDATGEAARISVDDSACQEMALSEMVRIRLQQEEALMAAKVSQLSLGLIKKVLSKPSMTIEDVREEGTSILASAGKKNQPKP